MNDFGGCYRLAILCYLPTGLALLPWKALPRPSPPGDQSAVQELDGLEVPQKQGQWSIEQKYGQHCGIDTLVAGRNP